MEGSFLTTGENMTRGSKKATADAVGPTSIRLTETINERLTTVVDESPLSKNDVLRVLIRIGLSQVEKDSNVLLNEHLAILKEQKAEKEAASEPPPARKPATKTTKKNS